MRLALFASALTAVAMWLALGGAPVSSQEEPTTRSCAACAQSKARPRCGHGHGHGSGHPHRYDYKCVHQSERTTQRAAEAMTAQFNGLGQDGWRLAKADNGFWCFMRVQDAK